MSGTWIQTYTGKAFDLVDPQPDMVDVRDIAHSLGMQCRFTGHTQRHYSVAEHCCRMAEQFSGAMAVHALLHDAAEAYVSDTAKPLKALCPQLWIVEDRAISAIYEALGVERPDAGQRDMVKHADLRMLITERNQLMEAPPMPWDCDEQVEPYDIVLECWPHELASSNYELALCRLGMHYMEEVEFVVKQVAPR